MSEVTVRPVTTKSEREAFIRLPWAIYRDHPCWVPPLIFERRRFLDPRKNPFFQHSKAELFLAERGGEVVGRVAAIRFQRHLDIYQDGVGFFGFFEAVDDQEVACALLERAREWLRGEGLTRIRGPMSFTINDECGLLVDAFDQMPVVMMPYNPAYYPRLLAGCGLAKVQDLYAFRLEVPSEMPERLAAVEERVRERYGVVIRPVRMADFDAEIDRLHGLHSQAWAGNWGAVPLTREEMALVASDLKHVIDPELVLFAEVDGEAVGLSVSVPNFNPALRHMNGRLFPFGLARFLWHKRRVDSGRVLIMGVLEDYRMRGVDAALYARSLAAGMAKGYTWGEMSWILESNRPMIRVLERLGTERYKTYRVYEGEVGAGRG